MESNHWHEANLIIEVRLTYPYFIIFIGNHNSETFQVKKLMF